MSNNNYILELGTKAKKASELLSNISTKIKNELFSQFRMIGFSKIEIDPDGYRSGKLNALIEN